MSLVSRGFKWPNFNPLDAELNPICHLLALLGAHHILHVSRVRVKGYLHYPPICANVYQMAFFPSGFPMKSHKHFFSPIRATCTTHLILPGERYQ